jgi:rhodanese-related sulfurtransferase
LKTSKDYLAEATSIVEKIDVKEGISKHEDGKALFIDVRDSADIARTGTIANCLRIPRGMMEFVADPSTPFYNEAITDDKEILLICGAGGMAALTGKTLTDMGYAKVHNLGGFNDWKEAGGPTQ